MFVCQCIGQQFLWWGGSWVNRVKMFDGVGFSTPLRRTALQHALQSMIVRSPTNPFTRR